MEFVRLLLWLLAVTCIGWSAVYLVLFRGQALSLSEKLSISYGLGIAFTSLEMLLFHFFKLEFTVLMILVPWMPLFLANAIVSSKRLGHQRAWPKDEKGRPSALAAFLACGILFEASYVFFRALIKPMESYDAVAIYAIKAKIFYLARSIPGDFFLALAKSFPHPDYPLNIPLAETLGYLFLGNLNDQLAKILFPLYFLAILAGLYFAVRRFAGRTYALLFTFLLASIPQFSAYGTNGYLDIPLAYYVFFGAIFLFKWFEDTANVRFLRSSAVMTGLAAWTKNEGLIYGGISILLILIFFLFEQKGPALKAARSLSFYGGVVLALSLPWHWVKTSAHIINSDVAVAALTPLGIAKQLYKVGPIVYEFQKQFFGPKKWNILWFVILFASIVNYKKVFTPSQRYISIFLVLAVSGYIFFYLVSHVEINFFLSRTWSRFLLHFLPVAVYWLALILRDDVTL